MTITTFQVEGMTCAHCEKSVTDEVSSIAGVTGVDVSAATGVLRIESTAALDDSAALDALHAAVLAAVDEAGYRAVLA